MDEIITTRKMDFNSEVKLHQLQSIWTFYSHSTSDSDWSYKSYMHISTLSSVEETFTILTKLSVKVVQSCMLFIMRGDIKPMWEDEKNRGGGCFSFKVSNNMVHSVWSHLTYMLVGETLFKDNVDHTCVNGITISPKKNFCIIKIWMKDCTHQNSNDINYIEGLLISGCLFKKHTPEF